MLGLEEWIAQSDDDLEIWASVTAGFDDDKNFVIKLSYTDYEEEENNYERYATIKLHKAVDLAQKLGVRLTELPLELKRRCGYRSDILVPSQVENCYRETLELIVGYGVRYRLSDK